MCVCAHTLSYLHENSSTKKGTLKPQGAGHDSCNPHQVLCHAEWVDQQVQAGPLGSQWSPRWFVLWMRQGLLQGQRLLCDKEWYLHPSLQKPHKERVGLELWV